MSSMIDSRIPRFNQAVLAAVVFVSFLIGFFWTVPLWAIFLLGGVIAGPRGNPVQALVRYLVLARLGPPSSVEDARPPRFAASLGFLFLSLSTASYLAGLHTVAWALALLVGGLAAVAALFGLCIGCELYVWIMKSKGRFLQPKSGELI